MSNMPNPNSGPNPTPEADLRLHHFLIVTAMSLLILVLLFVILRELSFILRPFLVAVFVCYLIIPAHRWLVAHKLPSMTSYVIIIGAVMSVMFVAGNMLYRGLSEMTRELPKYVIEFESRANAALDDFNEKIDRLTRKHRDDMEDEDGAQTRPLAPDAEELAESPPAQEPATLPAVVTTSPTTDVLDEEQPPRPYLQIISPERIGSWGRSTLQTFLGFFTGTMVIILYMIFLLAEAASFEKRLNAAFGRDRADRAMSVVRTINSAISRYISVKTLVSALIGIISGTVLALFGVKFALMWGILTFFANFIPYIGSLAAVSMPIGLSYVQFSDPWTTIIIGVILITAQVVTGNVLEPVMVGHRLGVSPLLILLSLAFWGFLWGIPGMILSAPLAVTIKIVMENIGPTRNVAKLFSDV